MTRYYVALMASVLISSGIFGKCKRGHGKWSGVTYSGSFSKGAPSKISAALIVFFCLLSRVSITLGPTASCVVVTFSSSNTDPLCQPSACLWHCSEHLFLKGGAPAQRCFHPKAQWGGLWWVRGARGVRELLMALPTWGRGAAQAPPAPSSWAELGSEAGGGSGTPRRSW